MVVIITSMLTKKLLLTIPEALARTGIGRSFLYERLAEGSIRSVKAGRRRLIDAASLEAWATSLPQEQLKQSVKGGALARVNVSVLDVGLSKCREVE